MLHTSFTHADVRSERPETTLKRPTATTTALRPRLQHNIGQASPNCRDVRPERPERNIGRRTTETMPHPLPKLRYETLRKRLRDRLPPPDIPDTDIIPYVTSDGYDRQYALSLIYSCLCAPRLYGKAIPSLSYSTITRLHYIVKL